MLKRSETRIGDESREPVDSNNACNGCTCVNAEGAQNATRWIHSDGARDSGRPLADGVSHRRWQRTRSHMARGGRGWEARVCQLSRIDGKRCGTPSTRAEAERPQPVAELDGAGTHTAHSLKLRGTSQSRTIEKC